ATLAAEGGDPAQIERVLTEVAESFLRFHVVAEREAEERSEFGTSAGVVVAAPHLETDIYDLAGLLRLGEHIWS
ncbi:MAG: hypothetical protein ACRD0F_04390, partial [Acidimicrobiales bacterium]